MTSELPSRYLQAVRARDYDASAEVLALVDETIAEWRSLGPMTITPDRAAALEHLRDAEDRGAADSVYVDRLADNGVLTEVQSIWDTEDRGENPCPEAVPFSTIFGLIDDPNYDPVAELAAMRRPRSDL